MMKTKHWSIIFLSVLRLITAQPIGDVGINTSTPHRSAVLDLTSSNKGLLVPRLTTTAANDLALTAAEGLIIFDRDKKQFLGWNGGEWKTLGAVSSILPDQSFASWEVNGLTNYGPATFPATHHLSSIVSTATIQRGAGLSITGGPAPLSQAWGANQWPENISDAISQDKLVTITVNFVPGQRISFSRIAAHLLRVSGSGPSKTFYQFSVDSGVTFTDIGVPIDLPIESAPGNYIPEISLRPYAALQALNTTTVPFLIIRILNYGATAPVGRWYLADSSGPDFELIGDILN